MRMQRTRTKQLRTPLTTTLGHSKKYAEQFQLMFVQLGIIRFLLNEHGLKLHCELDGCPSVIV